MPDSPEGAALVAEWQPLWLVVQSHVDPGVWVPLECYSDTSGVYLAGGIRAVKRAVEDRVGDRVPLRWKRVSEGCWEYQANLGGSQAAVRSDDDA